MPIPLLLSLLRSPAYPGVGSHADVCRPYYCSQLRGPAVRRPVFRLAGGKNRPYRRIAYHHHHVRTHGCGLPFCLERLVNSCYSLFTGVGIGAEVPVASAYINEFVGAKKRGRFFLLYEVIFPIGMMFAGLVGYFLVPIYGWKVMFLIGLVPSALTVPLRWLMPESPRWLTAKGRLKEADSIVSTLESEVIRRGMTLPEPEIKAPAAQKAARKGLKPSLAVSINPAPLCYGDCG